MLKRAYSWAVSWSETPYGGPALFAMAVAESSFFPLPPDLLLLVLCAGQPRRSFWFAGLCSAGSVLGGAIGYAIGLWAFAAIAQPVIQFYDPHLVHFEEVRALYETWGFWGVLAAAVTPIPYKVFTIASGAFHFDFFQFLLASVVGRSARFFFEGGLIFWGGEPLKDWLERYLDWVAWGLLVAIVGGILLLRLL